MNCVLLLLQLKQTETNIMFLLIQAGTTKEEEQLELGLTIEELLDYDLDSCSLTASQAI